MPPDFTDALLALWLSRGVLVENIEESQRARCVSSKLSSSSGATEVTTKPPLKERKPSTSTRGRGSCGGRKNRTATRKARVNHRESRADTGAGHRSLSFPAERLHFFYRWERGGAREECASFKYSRVGPSLRKERSAAPSSRARFPGSVGGRLESVWVGGNGLGRRDRIRLLPVLRRRSGGRSGGELGLRWSRWNGRPRFTGDGSDPAE